MATRASDAAVAGAAAATYSSLKRPLGTRDVLASCCMTVGRKVAPCLEAPLILRLLERLALIIIFKFELGVANWRVLGSMERDYC